MTTANGTLNARTARKSLADQIDRLDGILDGLAEALNESVADAVKDVTAETVRQAVHAAVTEVLSSPDLLRATLEKHAPPPANPMPPIPERKPPTLKENVARIGNRRFRHPNGRSEGLGLPQAVRRRRGRRRGLRGDLLPRRAAVLQHRQRAERHRDHPVGPDPPAEASALGRQPLITSMKAVAPTPRSLDHQYARPVILRSRPEQEEIRR